MNKSKPKVPVAAIAILQLIVNHILGSYGKLDFPLTCFTVLGISDIIQLFFQERHMENFFLLCMNVKCNEKRSELKIIPFTERSIPLLLKC